MDNEDRDRVREATDLVELIAASRELRRSGRNWTVLCPFHNDTRPSLDINPAKQIWKCWPCDIGGDCFDWIMKTEGIGFREALERLADRAGYTLTRRSGGDGGKYAQRPGLYAALQWAVDLYRSGMTKSSPAAEYLLSRGISWESIRSWGVGVAPSSWTYLVDACQRGGIDTDTLVTAGLVGVSDKGRRYDRFRARIIFPILDSQSRTIALGGRVIPGADAFGGKYINSPETPIFSKHKQMYGLEAARDAIRSEGRVLIVEGYTDAIVAAQHGVKNVVACLGTAVTVDHLRQLRYFADEIVLLLDGDEAGQKRAVAVLPMLVGSRTKVMTLPDNLDPADYVIKHGADALRRCVDRADDPILFRIKQLCSGYDPREESARSREAMDEVLELVVTCEPLDADLAIRRMRDYFGVRESVLLRRLGDKQRRVQRAQKADELKSQAEVAKWRLSRQERTLLALLVGAADEVIDTICEKIGQARLSDPVKRLVDCYETRAMQGESLAFAAVVASIEDPALKNLLVGIASSQSSKESRVGGLATPRTNAAIASSLLHQMSLNREQPLSIATGWEETLDSIARL